MATSLLKTLRFRIIFGIALFSWTECQAIIITQLGYSWKEALLDSGISNILLAGIVLLINVTLQFYIPQKNKYFYLTSLCVVLTAIWLFVSKTLQIWIINNVPYEQFLSKSLLIRGAFGFLIAGCMALISVLWYTVQDQQEIEKRKTEAEKLSKEAELYKLRQQLQPHFLFNSLNSINALIGSQPQQARTMIQQLSDFLRGTLRKEDHQWISLQEELQHLQLYLEIEKVRFGHRLSTQIKNETSTDLKLPAMLLQPVVENAIKFGLYDTTGEICISIDALQQNGDLMIQVKNPYDPETSAPKGTGFGLSSVQRRLYLLFARNDLLQTESNDNLFITTIQIPQPK